MIPLDAEGLLEGDLILQLTPSFWELSRSLLCPAVRELGPGAVSQPFGDYNQRMTFLGEGTYGCEAPPSKNEPD